MGGGKDKALSGEDTAACTSPGGNLDDGCIAILDIPTAI
jgi:hypothetical protein